MAARCGSSRRLPASPPRTCLAQEEYDLTWAMDAQDAEPAPVDDGQPLRPRRAAGRRCRRRRRRRPARAGGRAGRRRQDPHAHRRRRRPRTGTAGRVRRRPDREGGPRPGTRHRHPRRHRRQAAPRMATHRPATAARVPARRRHDGDRRRSRHALHPRPAPARPARRRQRVAARAGRRPPPTAGVGRGGLFAELCANGRVDQLEHLHRFPHDWEAAASLQLRSGDPRGFDAYEAHGRIVPGSLEDHLARMATPGSATTSDGGRVALVASTNDHVDPINRAVQQARARRRRSRPNAATRIAGGERRPRRRRRRHPPQRPPPHHLDR